MSTMTMIPTVFPSTGASHRPASSTLTLLAALLLAQGCGGKLKEVNPRPPALSWQELGPDQLDLAGVVNLVFDPQGRPITANQGVRRWDPSTASWSALGTDLPFLDVTADGAGGVYQPGYALPAGKTLWQRLPNLPASTQGLAGKMNNAPVADAKGNLYAIEVNDNKLFFLPKGATTWQPVTGATGSAVALRASRARDQIYVQMSSGVFKVAAGNTTATLSGAEALPLGFDDAGNIFYFNRTDLFRVSPDGTRTQIAQTKSPYAQFNHAEAQDRAGAFYASVIDDSDVATHLLKLEPGSTVWKDVATLSNKFNGIAVRDDGLVLEFSPLGKPTVNELYASSSATLLPDATERGVHFSPSRITLIPGDFARVGLTLSGATSNKDVAVSGAAGLTTSTALAVAPHGLAGTLNLKISTVAPAGTQRVKVTSPSGDSGELEVVIVRTVPDRKLSRQRTLAAGLTYMAVRSDGTVWAWPSTPESANPTQRAHQVPGLFGVRSLAQDLDGYGAAYAVRVDGKVIVWNTFRPEFVPLVMPGLADIVQVAAAPQSAIALDASGQVWVWASGDAVNFNIGRPEWAPPVKVPGLDSVVAIGPYSAVKADGTVWTRLNRLPPQPEQVESAGGVTALRQGWALCADGSVRTLPTSASSVANNDLLDLDALSFSVPQGGGHTGKTSLLVMLRSDGTVWDGTVYSDTDSNFSTVTTSAGNVQLEAPADVRAVADIGNYVQHPSVVTGDGSAWIGTTEGGTGPFIKIPGVDGLRDPADVQDFGVFPPSDGAVISAGSTVTVQATVARTGGFTGPLTVSADGPLPAGLSFNSVTIPADATSATLTFTASASLAQLGRAGVPLLVTSGSKTRRAVVALRSPFPAAFSHPTLAAGNNFGVALATNGIVSAWGANGTGQLGQGSADSTRHGTAVVVPGLSNIVQVAAGLGHAVALDSAGVLWGWGQNDQGQLGAAPDPTLSPRRIAGLPTLKGVAASGKITVALAVDGSLWQVGVSPTKLLDGPGPAAISTSGFYELDVLLIYPNGSVTGLHPSAGGGCNVNAQSVVRAAGGAGNYLFLRNDLTVSSCSGTDYPELTGTIALGQQHMVKSDGSVWTLDRINSGLSSGTTPPATGAFQVTGLDGAVDIDGQLSPAPGSYGLALVLKGDGTVWAYGNNSLGQAGGPGTTSSIALTPQQIPGLSGVRLP
jgi:hypothetical protein